MTEKSIINLGNFAQKVFMMEFVTVKVHEKKPCCNNFVTKFIDSPPINDIFDYHKFMAKYFCHIFMTKLMDRLYSIIKFVTNICHKSVTDFFYHKIVVDFPSQMEHFFCLTEEFPSQILSQICDGLFSLSNFIRNVFFFGDIPLCVIFKLDNTLQKKKLIIKPTIIHGENYN